MTFTSPVSHVFTLASIYGPALCLVVLAGIVVYQYKKQLLVSRRILIVELLIIVLAIFMMIIQMRMLSI